MLILKTWSVVGERWSRTEFMKVMVSGVVESVGSTSFSSWDF